MNPESICALCGQPKPITNTAQLTTPLADEITVVQEEIGQLDALIRQLNTKRVTLLRRLNDIKSATRALPPEVLSTIFQHVVPSNEFTISPPPKRVQEFSGLYTPIVLAAVSSYWRDAAKSTPHLWTRIAVEVHSSTAQRTLALLRLYFENSRQLPMSLALFVRCTDEIRGQRNELMTQLGAYLDPVSRLVFIENPDRIKRLCLDKVPLEWLPFLTDDFEQLEDLYLGWPRVPLDWRTNFGALVELMDIPSLRRVTMQNLHGNTQISWSTLTIIELCNVSVGIAVNLLLSCRHVVEYYLRDPRPGNILFDREYRPGENPAIFPNLKVFGWHFTTSGDHDVPLFRTLQFPALEKLCFYTDHPPWRGDLIAGFIYFLSRLPPTLSVLELVNLTGTEAFLNEVFGSGIQPRTLNIVVDGAPMFLSTIFSVLRPSRSSPPVKHLPYLENIHIRGLSGRLGIFDRMFPEDYPHYEENLIEGFLQMVEERRDHDDGAFCLEVSNVWRSASWTPTVKERLKVLVESGVQLQIIENSRPIDWL